MTADRGRRRERRRGPDRDDPHVEDAGVRPRFTDDSGLEVLSDDLPIDAAGLERWMAAML